jgi:predicted nucleic acid-binding protein
MIVLDASVVVDLLIKPAAHTSELRARIRAAGIVYAPHLMDAEVTNTLRRHLLRGWIDQVSARRAIRRLASMQVRWRPHRPLLGRALALRDQLSAYDAIYVAVAEVTGATLVTRDARLARAGGHRARIEVV